VNIVFWGTPQYAADNLLSLIQAGHKIIAVVTQPDRRRSRGKNLSPSFVKQIAIEFDIPVFTTHSINKDQVTRDSILKLNSDIFIVVAFGQILPKEILEHPKLGCWNSHASLLPKWRGAAPIQWSIINDDSQTGVCIMSMDIGLDTGPVINQECIEIQERDNLEILTKKLSIISSKLLIDSLSDIKKTIGMNKQDRLRSLKAIDQSEISAQPSYARQIVKEDYLIDWNNHSRYIFKIIKGLYPNAYTTYDGKRIKLLEVTILNYKCNFIFENNININKLESDINNAKPGEIVLIQKKLGIIVRTSDHALVIDLAQLAGKKANDGYTVSKQANMFDNRMLG
tara:strand:+ start:505 stop:1524 length:1020 start_codon:yes stop_codon:yes gene_type:complete